MKAPLYNQKGEAVGEVEIPDSLFAVRWNPDLVHQALLAQAANRRLPWAHAKGRGEVRGGGKKPWKQKHTGRARHGSIRSPIWKGGGVSHGPVKERDYSVKLNKKMLRGAIASVLSKRLKEGELKIVENMAATGKTKEFAKFLSAFGLRLNALVIPSKENKMVYRSAANIPNVKPLGASSLNVQDLLKYKQIILEKNALAEMK
jgi:large subunit ribosomal protein L4